MPVDLQTFRDLTAGICAPVTVVITAKDDIPYGATVRAFASLSLDPPMGFAQRVADRFSSASWYFDGSMPRLAGAASWLVCNLKTSVEGGDHVLLLGAVEDGQRSDAAPLIYTDKMYGTHSAMLNRPQALQSTAMRGRRLNCARAAVIKEVLAHTGGPIAREGNEYE